MIEKKFVSQKLKEFQVQEYIKSQLAKTGYSHTEIKRTPLGEKIVIYTTRPGLVVGRKGENIQNLTNTLKRRFKMENPQIEIGEIENPMLDVDFVSDRIVSTLERYGSQRFKSIGYKTLQNIMDTGAMGAEIVISGKVPGARARTWRFSAGYLKKSGDISLNFVKRSYGIAHLKPGIVGIKVSIMLQDTPLPDKIVFIEGEKEKEKQEPKEKKKKETKEKKKTEIKVEETSAKDVEGLVKKVEEAEKKAKEKEKETKKEDGNIEKK